MVLAALVAHQGLTAAHTGLTATHQGLTGRGIHSCRGAGGHPKSVAVRRVATPGYTRSRRDAIAAARDGDDDDELCRSEPKPRLSPTRRVLLGATSGAAAMALLAPGEARAEEMPVDSGDGAPTPGPGGRAGPGTYCSPRLTTPLNSRDEGSTCVGWTSCGAIDLEG